MIPGRAKSSGGRLIAGHHAHMGKKTKTPAAIANVIDYSSPIHALVTDR